MRRRKPKRYFRQATVYQVQAEDGSGPYGAGIDFWHHETATGRPGPGNDGLHSFGREHIFGFRSKAALKRWFDSEDRKELKEYGFRVVRLKGVEDVMISQSKKQCVFLKGTEKHIEDVTDEFWKVAA